MATEVFMPRLTHDMQSGLLVEWLHQDGDRVQKGEPLFAVETDKATVDVEAEVEGVLRSPRFEPGDEVPVGATMAWITAANEEAPSAQPTQAAVAEAPAVAARPVQPAPAVEAAPLPPDAGGRVVASPWAKRLAREASIDLGSITGTGPHGRIRQADVQPLIDQQAARPAAASEAAGYQVVPPAQRRQAVAERMTGSMPTAPHSELQVEVDMSEVVQWRERVSAAGSPVTTTALLVCVVARTLRRHPLLNAVFVDGQLRQVDEINVGVTLSSAQGRRTVVVRRADELMPLRVEAALASLQQGAEEHRLAAQDATGSTFALSDVGLAGVDVFRATIQPPQVAILTVGRIVERPVGVGGEVVLRPTAHLVLSVDQRVIDGVKAAPFLADVVRLLENPFLIL